MTHLMPSGKPCGRPDGHNGEHRSTEALKRDREKRRQYAGVRAHPLYGTWFAMILRCEDPDHWAYKYYGAVGVKVCDRWHDARSFFEDIEREIGSRPDGMTLDRMRTDGSYEPGNVRWATRSEQRCNRRDFDADRVLAVISRFKSGATRPAIAEALSLDYPVVKGIIAHWRKGGYQGLEIGA